MITDATGKMVFQTTGNQSSHDIHPEGVERGIYFAKLSMGGAYQTMRFIVQ